MSPDRLREIRRAASHRAAAELSAVMNHWEGRPAELYPDPDEREEFEAALHAIVRRLASA